MPYRVWFVVVALCGACWDASLALGDDAEDERENRPIAEVSMRRSGLILVPVTVQGAELTFILDTGFTLTCIDERHRYLLGEELGTVKITTPLSPTRVACFSPPSVACGGVEFETALEYGMGCFSMGDFQKVATTRIDGILGSDVLRQHVVQLDFAAGKVRFLKGVPPGCGEVLDLAQTPDGCPWVMLNPCDFVEDRFLLDTGSSFGIGLPARDFKFLVEDGGIQARGTMPMATISGRGWHRIGFAREISLGEQHRVRNVDVYSARHGVIGLECLQRFVITIDFSSWQVYLKAHDEPCPPTSFDLTGVYVAQDGDFFRVEALAPLGPAIVAGIELDDRILEIDGRETKGMTLEAIRTQFRTATQPVSCALERAGKRISLVIGVERKAISD